MLGITPLAMHQVGPGGPPTPLASTKAVNDRDDELQVNPRTYPPVLVDPDGGQGASDKAAREFDELALPAPASVALGNALYH